jgi:hypothetical protein
VITTVLIAGPAGMFGNRSAGHLPGQPDVVVRLRLRASAVKDPAKAAVADGPLPTGGRVTGRLRSA